MLGLRAKAYLHGVERAGQAKEGGEGNEAECNKTCAHLKLHKIAYVVEDTLAFLYC